MSNVTDNWANVNLLNIADLFNDEIWDVSKAQLLIANQVQIFDQKRMKDRINIYIF